MNRILSTVLCHHCMYCVVIHFAIISVLFYVHINVFSPLSLLCVAEMFYVSIVESVPAPQGGGGGAGCEDRR